MKRITAEVFVSTKGSFLTTFQNVQDETVALENYDWIFGCLDTFAAKVPVCQIFLILKGFSNDNVSFCPPY